MDLSLRVIVSWSVDDNIQDLLVREPLEKALLKRKIQPDSDRCGQYLSEKMKKLVQIFGLKQSMNNVDDPYNNAFVESLCGRLKQSERRKAINA